MTQNGSISSSDWCIEPFLFVTVAAPGAHPEGEIGVSVPPLVRSGESKRAKNFTVRPVCAAVLGLFVVLRCGFGCGCVLCL